MKANELLLKSSSLLIERGKEYDADPTQSAERSFSKTATAFNAITGGNITPAEVALLLGILKDVRQWANPDRLHEDSVVDSISYHALKGEELYKQFSSKKVEKKTSFSPEIPYTQLYEELNYYASDKPLIWHTKTSPLLACTVRFCYGGFTHDGNPKYLYSISSIGFVIENIIPEGGVTDRKLIYFHL